MTKEQKELLQILKDSKARGAASISCGQRQEAAEQLVKMGKAERYGFGYRIKE